MVMVSQINTTANNALNRANNTYTKAEVDAKIQNNNAVSNASPKRFLNGDVLNRTLEIRGVDPRGRWFSMKVKSNSRNITLTTPFKFPADYANEAIKIDGSAISLSQRGGGGTWWVDFDVDLKFDGIYIYD